MGKVIVKVKFTNTADLHLTEAGYLSKEKIRSLETEGIVETGAVLVNLPQKIVNEPGLDSFNPHPLRRAGDTGAGRGGIVGGMVSIRTRPEERVILF